MKDLAPIILFCYNRPEHLSKTIEALQKNDLAAESELFVYSDGAKNETDRKPVKLVREFLHTISGFKKVVVTERETNFGLARSVIEGVSEVIGRYEKVIVVEDDLVTAPGFLIFMNRCLDKYENHSSIFSLSGYTPDLTRTKDLKEDVYLFPRISSWGWGTWYDRWNSVDWDVSDFISLIRSKRNREKFNQGGSDLTAMLLNQKSGKINSWAIRFSYAAFKQSKSCLYPKFSLIQNIGADGSGTHIKKSKKYQSELFYGELQPCEIPHEYDSIKKEILTFYKQSVYRKIVNFKNRWVYTFKKWTTN